MSGGLAIFLGVVSETFKVNEVEEVTNPPGSLHVRVI